MPRSLHTWLRRGLQFSCLSASQLLAQSRTGRPRWDAAAVAFAAGCSLGSCLLFPQHRGERWAGAKGQRSEPGLLLTSQAVGVGPSSGLRWFWQSPSSRSRMTAAPNYDLSFSSSGLRRAAASGQQHRPAGSVPKAPRWDSVLAGSKPSFSPCLTPGSGAWWCWVWPRFPSTWQPLALCLCQDPELPVSAGWQNAVLPLAAVGLSLLDANWGCAPAHPHAWLQLPSAPLPPEPTFPQVLFDY